MLRLVRQYLFYMNISFMMPMVMMIPFQDPAPWVTIVVLMWTCLGLQALLFFISYKWNIKVVYIQAYLWHFRLFVGLVGKPEQHYECIPRATVEQDSLDTLQQCALILVNLLVLMYLHEKHSGKLLISTFICALLGLV